MNRLCIYLTYDKENRIDNYITYMLKALRTCCTDLLAVCHAGSGWQQEKALSCADQVIYRSNVGFDAGGYKDVLCKDIGWDRLDKFDELILLNDSFYGPFYPMKQIFDTMSRTEADFWGLTRSRAGTTIDGMRYGEHIQSYFLVFRKKVIVSRIFRDFWEQLKYPKTMRDAVREFELGINICLEQNGFRGAAVSDLYREILSFGENENPYMAYSLELIRDCRIPILKYKALFLGNSGYSDALKAFRFIEENHLYPIEYIKEHIRRKSRFEKGWIDFERLEKFQKVHKRIFIYGYGIYGKNVELYFQYRGWRVESFLVTQTDENCSGAIAYDQAQIREDDGIIVAVGTKKMCEEILECLVDKCNKGQIIYPNL